MSVTSGRVTGVRKAGIPRDEAFAAFCAIRCEMFPFAASFGYVALLTRPVRGGAC